MWYILITLIVVFITGWVVIRIDSSRNYSDLDKDQLVFFRAYHETLDGARMSLEANKLLYPSAMAVLAEGNKTEYFNFQNEPATLDEIERQLKDKAADIVYSCVVYDDPDNSRLIIKSSLSGLDKTEIAAVPYIMTEGKCTLQRESLKELGDEDNYLRDN